MLKNSFIFDFDSTIISIESLDEIIKICLHEKQNTNKIIAQIEGITNLGMSGGIDLLESLNRRLQTVSINKKHIEELKSIISKYITPGISDIIKYLQEKEQNIFIISGGFKECILPVADILNISHDNCFGNEFRFDSLGNVVGIYEENPLCRSNGKHRVIKHLKKSGQGTGQIYIIGDGYTDLVPYLDGVADEFLGFGVNRLRSNVRDKAPHFFITTKDMLEYLRDLPVIMV